MKSKSMFDKAPDIIPRKLKKNISIQELIEFFDGTSFEARNVARGAGLFEKMISQGDTIWLGIAGAGIAGGMGGIVISLIENGFIDVICSTGAQVYHDLHFAFGLPVKKISPVWDDDILRKHGDTRIYDIGIREKETLEAQDELIRQFVREKHESLSGGEISSFEFNFLLGKWVLDKAPYPERSFVARAAKNRVPVFWDSLANHSIAMNLVKTDLEGMKISLSPQKDIFQSAAIAYFSTPTGFVELGGGGPKNFIQQTGPTLSQILNVKFEGADRGLQIGTAVEKEGSLSSCTFGEAVTWGKYQKASEDKLVQIWGEYSVIFPIISAYVIDKCSPRAKKTLAEKIPEFSRKLSDII
ncbi:deoxyhypusine synthase [candidate division KSB1 bacterium]|nr:MAG: deoxyhypusine synthase [candidate division KSB1 bacterium]